MFGFLSKFLPSGFYIYVALAIAAFAAGGTSAWKVQNWRQANAEKDRLQAELVAEREFARNETKRQQNAIDSFNAARAREAKLRTDADAARLAVDRVRSAADSAVERAKADHATCLVATVAFRDVFGQCVKEYRSLGETADRWVNDIQVMQDQWPK